MRDDFREELISAYLDGELDAGERAVVERAMAESAAYRQLYEELQALRAGLQRLPRYTLPEDFHRGVVRQVERGLLVSSPESAATVAAPTARGPARRRWPAAALIAASVAAAILAAVLLVSPLRRVPPPGRALRPTGNLAGGPAPVVQPEARRQTPRPLPGKDELALASTQGPIYFMVIDLAITPQGQQNRVFEESLKAAGIRFDPAIKVDGNLEKELLDNRFLGDIEKAAPGQSRSESPEGAQAEIEMFFVAGGEAQIESAILGLQGRAQEEIPRVRFDLTMESRKENIFRQLNSAVRLAREDAVKVPRAYRLVFRFSLRGGSRGFLGTIATPSWGAQLVPQETPQDETPARPQVLSAASRGAGKAEGSPVLPPAGRPPRGQSLQASREPEPEEALAEVLFVLRNLKPAPSTESGRSPR